MATKLFSQNAWNTSTTLPCKINGMLFMNDIPGIPDQTLIVGRPDWETPISIISDCHHSLSRDLVFTAQWLIN